MKTTLIVSNKMLPIITHNKFNYEINEQLSNEMVLITLEHVEPSDIYYLGYEMGMSALLQAHLDADIHSLPVVSEDKGHSQGDKTTEDKSAQGNQ